MKNPALAIHGGAGTISRNNLSSEKERQYREALADALASGRELLTSGAHALDVVERCVRVLEDCPLFNAGRGSVFTHEGTHEMDASVMRGDTLAAGAVAGVHGVKNPVSLARHVMENTRHVMLCGEGALAYAREAGLEMMPEDWFFSAFRHAQWQDARKDGDVRLDHAGDRKFGTVGAVALDRAGNLAAATSTGGMTNKRSGRVGDTPLVGAGTYANNQTCAVSCTGDGEYFIRAVAAYDLACLMQYGNYSLEEAARKVIMEKIKTAGGEGGLIAIDASGHIVLPFNSEGMYRGWWREGEPPKTGIYRDE